MFKKILKFIGILVLGFIVVSVAAAVLSGGKGLSNGSSRTVSSAPPQVSTNEKADAKYLDPRLLTSDAESYKGQNVFLQGNALNVEQQDDHTWINVLAEVRGGTGTESIVVELRPPAKQLLSDECYRFYGIVEGTTETRVILTGATNETPLISGYAYSKSEPADYGGCASP